MPQRNSRNDIFGSARSFPATGILADGESDLPNMSQELVIQNDSAFHTGTAQHLSNITYNSTPGTIIIVEAGLYLLSLSTRNAESALETVQERWQGICIRPGATGSYNVVAEAQGGSVSGIVGGQTRMTCCAFEYLEIGDEVTFQGYNNRGVGLRSTFIILSAAVLKVFEFTDAIADAGATGAAGQVNSREDFDVTGASINHRVITVKDENADAMASNPQYYRQPNLVSEDPDGSYTINQHANPLSPGRNVQPSVAGIYCAMGTLEMDINSTGFTRNNIVGNEDDAEKNAGEAFLHEGYNDTWRASSIFVWMVEASDRIVHWGSASFSAGSLSVVDSILGVSYLGSTA